MAPGNTRQLWSGTSLARRVLPARSGAPGASRVAPPARRAPHLPGPETSDASVRCSGSQGRPSGPPPHCRGQGRAETPRRPSGRRGPLHSGSPALLLSGAHTCGTSRWCRKARHHTCCLGTLRFTPGGYGQTHCPCLLGAPSVCRRQLGARRPLALPRFPGSSWGPAALPLRTDGRGWRPQTSHPQLPRGSPCGGRASLLRPQRLTPDLPLGICPAAARPEAPCRATFQQTFISSHSTCRALGKDQPSASTVGTGACSVGPCVQGAGHRPPPMVPLGSATPGSAAGTTQPLPSSHTCALSHRGHTG